MYEIWPDACTRCEECVESCPVEAIVYEGNNLVINHDVCVDCGLCKDVCPEDAIMEI